MLGSIIGLKNGLGKFIQRLKSWEKTGALAIAITICYQTALAILYGGYPFGMYPDEFWNISTGMYLVNDVTLDTFHFPVTAERAILVPLVIGILYRQLGFPLFLYFLCSWNALTMAILLLSAYLIGEHFFDKKTGTLAALLIGWNWFIGWYGNKLLEDVGMVAFAFLSIAFYCKYLRHHNWRHLFVSGFAAALSIMTKESALYLLLPLMAVFTLKRERQKLMDISIFTGSFVIGLSPFMYVSYMRYGDPLKPIFARLMQFKGASPGLLFNFLYIEMVPFALSFVVFLSMIWGLGHLIKKKFFLFPMWAAYCLAFYVFLIPYGPFDKYMTHYIPIFLLISAFGLKNLTEICLRKYGRIGIIPVPLALLFTNLYGPPLFYSFSKRALVTPMFLHQRLGKWDKYVEIAQLIKQVQSKQSDWWFAQLFYDRLGPDFTLILTTVTVLAIFAAIYLVLTRTGIQSRLGGFTGRLDYLKLKNTKLITAFKSPLNRQPASGLKLRIKAWTRLLSPHANEHILDVGCASAYPIGGFTKVWHKLSCRN